MAAEDGMFSVQTFIFIFVQFLTFSSLDFSLLLYLQETGYGRGRCPSKDSSESEGAASAVELVLAKTPLGLAPIAQSAAAASAASVGSRASPPLRSFLTGEAEFPHASRVRAPPVRTAHGHTGLV